MAEGIRLLPNRALLHLLYLRPEGSGARHSLGGCVKSYSIDIACVPGLPLLSSPLDIVRRL